MRLTAEQALVPSHTVVENAAELRHYWATLRSLWRLPSHMQHFPGSHPVAVDETTARLMRESTYVSTYKTDGVRYLLLLCCRPDGAPIALMIDRAGVMYEVVVWAEQSFFVKGTVLDGELAHELDTSDFVFLVFDAVAAAGEHVADRPFSERLQVIHNVVFRAWKAHMTDDELEAHVIEERKITMHHVDPTAIRMQPKSFVPFSHTAALWRDRASHPHRIDGLLFTRCDAPMQVGRTQRILKWKEHHTLDVRLDADGTPHLKAPSGRSDATVPMSEALPGAAWSVVRNEIVAADVPGASAVAPGVYECALELAAPDSASSHRLVPLRARLDKEVPNAVSTAQSTLAVHRGAWTVEDVVAAVASDFSPARAKGRAPRDAKRARSEAER